MRSSRSHLDQYIGPLIGYHVQAEQHLPGARGDFAGEITRCRTSGAEPHLGALGARPAPKAIGPEQADVDPGDVTGVRHRDGNPVQPGGELKGDRKVGTAEALGGEEA
jgi:hypothetical protein